MKSSLKAAGTTPQYPADPGIGLWTAVRIPDQRTEATVIARLRAAPAVRVPRAQPNSSRAVRIGACDDPLLRRHERAVLATMRRRRSLTTAVTAALMASWAVVEDAPRAHEAALNRTLRLSRQFPGGLDVETARRRDDECREHITQLLTEIGMLHQVTWTLPVPALARLLLATMRGLMNDFVRSGTPTLAREVIPLFAYHLSQHGRRNSERNVDRIGGVRSKSSVYS